MKVTTAVVAASLLFAASAAATGEDSMQKAMEHYERQNYSLARFHFLSAAKAGDARAQEILGFMHAFGPAMYPGVDRDFAAAAHWFDLAARAGRPVGRYMACALLKRRMDSPVAVPPHCFDWVAETGQPARR